MLTKRYFLLLILLLGGMTSTVAQNIVVQGFRLDEKDLTANTAGTTVIDPNNGQKCALIKIETIQTGFTFDVGMLGVVKTEQHPGEVWVYVPEGVKRITITHPQLGILRDHDLGMSLKRAKTYIMRLVTGEVQTTVRQARTSQFVVFTLDPQNAVVRLDGNMLSTTDGTAQKYMPFGTYDYTVEAPDYHSEVGKVTVNDPRNKHVVNVKLRPNFSRVTLTVDNNAEIWVNGERKGSGSWTGNLGAGVYMLETRLANHRSASRQAEIAVTSEPQTIRLDAPTPILGEASIGSTPALADVFVDGKKVGQTPLVVPDLLIGQHTVKVAKQGYADYETQIVVSEGQTADVNAKLGKNEMTNMVLGTPEMQDFSYTFGVANTQGLKKYLSDRMHIDTLLMEAFIDGFDKKKMPTGEAEVRAYLAGEDIKIQVDTAIIPTLEKQINYGNVQLNRDSFIKGFRDALLGRSNISIGEAQKKVKKNVDVYVEKKLRGENAAYIEKNRTWLENNKNKPDVKVTSTGLQYKVLRKGTGRVPKSTNKVKVNYEGRLIDGTEFDSSYKRNEPSSFGVDKVIKGWTEALTLMPVGSKWEVYIPEDLGYGSRDSGKIPPFSTLIFTIELLDIVE